MSRRPILAGNWKMFMLSGPAKELAAALAKSAGNLIDRDMVLIPPFTALSVVKAAIAGTNISLGAQNVHAEPQGAFTGEVSAPMLVDAGCRYVVIGHSERRQFFEETNGSCNAKIKAALAAGLIPIYCIGETLDQREYGQTFKVIETQLTEGLANFTSREIQDLVLAYEPVWAIGTGRTATPDQAQEVHAFIRAWLKSHLDVATAEALRIQYGGSVKPDNIDVLMACPDVDGALVGGASLKVESFIRIVQFQKR